MVNADDFGYNHSVNKAVDFCFKKGIISSSTLLVNFDEFEKTVEMIKSSDYYDKIGLHFNIVEGVPITKEIKNSDIFCDSSGHFSYKRKIFKLISKKEIKLLQDECEAQVNKMINAGLNISHMDSHRHTHTEILVFMSIVKILKRYNIKKVRIPYSYNRNPYGIKSLYKKLFIIMLRLLGFETTDLFYSYYDSFHLGGKSIELMIHPYFTDNNELFDSVTQVRIEKKYNI